MLSSVDRKELRINFLDTSFRTEKADRKPAQAHKTAMLGRKELQERFGRKPCYFCSVGSEMQTSKMRSPKFRLPGMVMCGPGEGLTAVGESGYGVVKELQDCAVSSSD